MSEKRTFADVMEKIGHVHFHSNECDDSCPHFVTRMIYDALEALSSEMDEIITKWELSVSNNEFGMEMRGLQERLAKALGSHPKRDGGA